MRLLNCRLFSPERRTRFTPVLLLLIAVLGSGSGCAPVFSDFQGARMVKPGRAEITPAASYVSAPQYTAGLQVAYGLHRRAELRARLTHVFRPQTSRTSNSQVDVLNDLDDALQQDFNVISAGLKFSLIKDRIALHLPAEAYFGGGDAGRVTGHPALLLSVPISDRLEFNPSINAILPAGFVAVNLGLAAGDLDRWAVRPEVGMLANTGTVSIGLGFSVRTGRP
jgi:hypothetical protein